MKRIMLMTIAFIMMSSLVFGASLNLRATWTANIEPDMREYKLYRVDGTRTLIATIPHPSTTHDFTITIPDGSSGTLRFVLTAVDTSNNESADSVEAIRPFDLAPPARPGGLGVNIR